MAEPLGKTIRILRQAKGLSVSILAQRAKISVPFLSLVEKGTREPSIDVLRKISEAIGIPCEALLLTAMGPDSGMAATKSETIAITEAVQQLVGIEVKLKELLARKESSSEIKRRKSTENRERDRD